MFGSGNADLVILGGNVITLDSARPRAQAVAVKFDRILAVGQDDEIKQLVGSNTRVIGASRKTVIPGLNDAHCHVLPTGRSYLLLNCGPDAVSSIAEIKKLVAEKTQTVPQGEWIVGFGYDDTKMAENWFLNRADLDEVATEHPVWIRHVGGHMSTTNSVGLRMANLTKDSEDPAGGKYGRELTSGELDGVI